MPQFFSSNYLNPQFDGSDELFDFDVLQENDYCQIPGALNCTYAINNLANRNLENPVGTTLGAYASQAFNDNYAWVSTALSGQGTNNFIRTDRFAGSAITFQKVSLFGIKYLNLLEKESAFLFN